MSFDSKTLGHIAKAVKELDRIKKAYPEDEAWFRLHLAALSEGDKYPGEFGPVRFRLTVGKDNDEITLFNVEIYIAERICDECPFQPVFKADPQSEEPSGK